jgi:hypothetical protein
MSASTSTTFTTLSEQTFASRDTLLAAVRETALSQGFAVSIARSIKDVHAYLKCDFGGLFRDRVNAPDGSKRRQTSTRLTGCPFSLYARSTKGGEWKLEARNLNHLGS